MERDVLISISGTQQFMGDSPETIQLVTRGTYRYEPGYMQICYVETEMTGMEGVVTTFTVEEGSQVSLSRTGKVTSTMQFRLGQKHESLYDAGFACLLIGVTATRMTVLLNEKGGIFDLEYEIEIEHTACGTNTYHIEVKPAE